LLPYARSCPPQAGLLMSNEEIFNALTVFFDDWYETAKLQFAESDGTDDRVAAAQLRGHGEGLHDAALALVIFIGKLAEELLREMGELPNEPSGEQSSQELTDDEVARIAGVIEKASHRATP
jgi:hypothetical protein